MKDINKYYNVQDDSKTVVIILVCDLISLKFVEAVKFINPFFAGLLSLRIKICQKLHS